MEPKKQIVDYSEEARIPFDTLQLHVLSGYMTMPVMKAWERG